jgi:co-chaperonin GroES (HSP10)
MDGSKLAAGARTAAFNVEGSEEFTHDLKTLTRTQFLERYEATERQYEELLEVLRIPSAGIEPLPRREKFTVPTGGDDILPKKIGGQVTHFHATVKVPEKVSYKAECRGDNVLVIRTEREHTAQFIIPESAKAKSDIGRVVARGPDVKRCAKGELVLFDRFAAHGKEIELVDEQGIPRQHLLLNDCDVLLGLTRFVPAADEPSPSES